MLRKFLVQHACCFTLEHTPQIAELGASLTLNKEQLTITYTEVIAAPNTVRLKARCSTFVPPWGRPSELTVRWVWDNYCVRRRSIPVWSAGI